MTSQPPARRPNRSRGAHRTGLLRGQGAALTLATGGAVLGWFLPLWEKRLPAPGLSFDASTAQAALGAVAGSMITLAGFIVTAITLVVQTVQAMSPRLVAALGRFSRFLALFGLLIGTALYALVTLSHIRGDNVPRLSVTLAVALVLLDAIVVLHLLASLRHAVTGGGLSRAVGECLRATIHQVHPVAAKTSPVPLTAHQRDTLSITHRGRPAVIASIDEARITRLADRSHLRIWLTRTVGDSVTTGDVVARVEPEAAAVDPLLDRRIAACLRYGPSRTLEQDTAYGFRLLADIAIRALSPGINDPTTAVQALDQIEDALLRLTDRTLGPIWLLGQHGTPRVNLPAPQWADVVSVALDETLLYGSSSLQTVRRLNALLQRLLATVPAERKPAVAERADALQRLATTRLPDPFLHRIAGCSDRQGLGGPSDSVDR
ncbi:DUF2254 domain-containing protein [Actinacidiphila glaucinigra]|uniref:DUF2254 domain-containing protein n=1 Tax=Actinacidiphila glaucinigra TaxID=235986 RepID=UPI0035D8820F